MNNPENTDIILMLTCFFPQNFKHYFFFFFKFLNIVQLLCVPMCLQAYGAVRLPADGA